jgi:predicted helicase
MAKGSSLLRDAVARCASWEDFVRQLRKKSDKEKGDLFEHLVRAYLQLDPEYATKLRKVWLLEDVPSALRKKLHLPASDQGIDLIAETNTGEYWAIQCKYRENTGRALTWGGDLSTFAGLAFGLCKNISFGLVCSTTERITSVLKHRERIGFCALDVWQGLDKEFFDRLRKLLGHKPTKLVPLKPRPHQKKAIADARKYFVGKKQRRGKLISPCGSGKSLTAYWIARDLKAKKIVVAVPSLALIRQTLKVWLRESLAHGDKVEWICVCSDESAGRVEQDDVAVLRQDLGVPCLTDPKEIASWLKQKKPGLTVVFTTYQSGEALGKAARRAKFAFDLGIMDEAHKTVGDGDKLFSHLLHDKNLTIRRRIFMTATERRYRGKGDKILSMDNAAIYGDTFHLLSFKRALETKPSILSDYRIVTILVSREEVAELIRKNVFVKPDRGRWNKEIEAEMLASLVALRKAMQKYPIKHAVSFHSSIQRAEIFKEHNEAYNQAFKRHGAIETFHVSGKTPTGTRARIVNEFAATDRGLITNARCLTEGVDVPDIDCVLFADPRRSAVDIVQAVGRALRPAKGKKMGYVIVPILHDAKAKPDDIFDSEEFQEILTTLRALAANDERIIEYFRSISQGKFRSGGGSVNFDIDEKLAKRIDLDRFAREIDLRCWSTLAKLSWRSFNEARIFARSLSLVTHKEWVALCQGRLPTGAKLPKDIPAAADRIYSGAGWISWGDWLGTGAVATRQRKYRSFSSARAFVRKLGLRSEKDWRAFRVGRLLQKGKLPADIPTNPNIIYLDGGWISMGDWLGTGTIATRQRKYRRFLKARAFARSLGLKSGEEWKAFCKGHLKQKGRLPADVPAAPNFAYADSGWAGMGDWLGTGRVANQLRKHRPFNKARLFAQSLGLASRAEWIAYCKGDLPKKARLPPDIPANPVRAYAKQGWAGMGDWLGTGTLAPQQRSFRSF